jgi:hypothetical protein
MVNETEQHLESSWKDTWSPSGWPVKIIQWGWLAVNCKVMLVPSQEAANEQ